MKRFVAVLAFFALFSSHVFAANFSGIWWNKNESGWGINFAQQGEIIFAAMYVYNTAGRPTWYTSAMTAGATTPGAFTGDLFEATGPYFGGTFNPANVTSRRVGTMSFNGPSFNAGTLTYNVDGVPVTKAIEQLAFTAAPVQGTYAITIASSSGNNCPITNFASPPARLLITGNSLQLQNSAGGIQCNAPGGAFQAGNNYGFVADAPSCLPASRLTALDLKAEGVAGLTNGNALLTGALVFQGNNSSCTSLFFVAGVRIQ